MTALVKKYLAAQQKIANLRFITCGNVDDGKSTLIGRLLHDCGVLLTDQMDDMGGDLAHLLDGLAAEREAGITIDIAWRFFASTKRRFIIADAPGHVEYTRNMATAASSAELAILLVDARHGIREQTKRHGRICALMGIGAVILAVNKMDACGYDEQTFNTITKDFASCGFGFRDVTAIPVSALHGDTVVERGDNMKWYRGATLLQALEAAPADADTEKDSFRMAVATICRHGDYRGYGGRIASGRLKPGDAIRVLPQGATSRIKAITIGTGEAAAAQSGQSVMVSLADEIAIRRGDVIASADDPCPVADQFEADVIWLAPETKGFAGRKLDFKIGTKRVSGSITNIKHRLDIARGTTEPATSLGLNDIARITISLTEPVGFTPYRACRGLGGFLIIDRHDNATLAGGMIDFALRRADNIHRQHLTITRAAREELGGHRGGVYWFTGLSGSGKSTIANAFEVALNGRGVRTYLLDGDNIRHGINRDLGFTDADRIENIRRIAEIARLMADAGMVVLTAFISPFAADRAMARELLGEADFSEIFVDTPLAVCEARDVKGLYKKARAGDLPNFTGISSPYEPPENPECRLETENASVEALVRQLMKYHDAKFE